MFFVKDTYCHIWKVDIKDKYADIRISTSEKDSRESGKYINSNWLGRCVGKAFSQIKNMDTTKNARIKSAKITNESYTDKEGNTKSAVRVTIFEFDSDDETTAQAATTKKGTAKAAKKESSKKESEESEVDEDYPF